MPRRPKAALGPRGVSRPDPYNRHRYSLEIPLDAGGRIGSYEVVARIGAGGMGEVYRAVDTDLKRSVAIKMLPDGFASDADRVARFQREAEILASLNHPHIAHVYGLEKAGGRLGLVMELVEGPSARATHRLHRRSACRHLGVRLRAVRNADRKPRLRRAIGPRDARRSTWKRP